jgi:secreted trypsin-like serine protease
MEHLRRVLVGGMAILLATAAGLASQPASADGIIGGGATPSVVGGTTAAAGEFPFMVRLSMGCGGAVVASRVVLTAAHCVSRTGTNTGITATIGRLRLSAGGGEVIRSTFVQQSPSYPSTGTSDWALIELATATAAPKLALAAQGDTSLSTGNFTVMGWGATREGGGQSDALRKATVPFVTDASCARSYGSDFRAATEICAGFTQGGVDTCQGDSGGPMVKLAPSGELREVGIVSYGNGCARPNFPGVYSEVQSFSNDILSRITSTGTIRR